MKRIHGVEKTIELYKNMGWKRWFAKIRFWDSPYEQVEKMIPEKGVIVDVGCGEGIFTNFLATCSEKRKIIGIEVDKKRFSQANRGLANTLFKCADATKVKLQKTDCIVLFHLLHHLNSFKDQEKLIGKCVISLESNGKLIIVEIAKKNSFKFLTTWLVDHLVVPILFERKFWERRIFFRNKNNWVKLLKSYKLNCKSYNAEEGKPFSHIIFECQKS